MAQSPAAIFKIPTESAQPARGRASRALKLVAAQPKAAGRVAGIETRTATRGDGEVIELDHGITVYPPKEKGGRWRAVWPRGDPQRAVPPLRMLSRSVVIPHGGQSAQPPFWAAVEDTAVARQGGQIGAIGRRGPSWE
jgi:hypothetical protein